MKKILLRYMLQITSLLLFVLPITSLDYPLGQENVVLQWYSRLDPWLLLSQIRWQQEIPNWSCLPLAALIVTLLCGRIFCGWLCPFGALLDFTDKIGRTVLKKMPNRLKALFALRIIRGYWLLFLAAIFIIGSNWVLFFTPFALFSHEITRIMTGHVPWVLLGIIFTTILFSRIWCNVLCPTGALLSVIAKFSLFRYQIDGNCIQCGKCIKTCFAGPMYHGSAGYGCLVCGKCQEVCPTKSIQWRLKIRQEKTEQAACTNDKVSLKHKESRRTFLKAAFTIAAAVILWKKIILAEGEKVVRPPGAIPEAEFTAVCNRCGRCIKVCPAKAIQPMPISYGLGNFETPYIIPRKNRCDLCLACQEVCPTGAIAKIPIERVSMGKAVIDHQKCIAWKEDKLCFICGEQCPMIAIDGDEKHRPSVKTDKCVGCGSCENACPINGEAAICVIPVSR